MESRLKELKDRNNALLYAINGIKSEEIDETLLTISMLAGIDKHSFNNNDISEPLLKMYAVCTDYTKAAYGAAMRLCEDGREKEIYAHGILATCTGLYYLLTGDDLEIIMNEKEN